MVVLFTQPVWSKKEMTNIENCRRNCIDLIDIDECVEDEISYWNTEQSTRRGLIRSCKELIRNEYRYCMEECKDVKSDT